MKDLTAIKSLLNQAYRATPSNFNLQEVRFHIARAIQQINHVEKKAVKRAIVQKEQVIKQYVATPEMIKALDKMIADEEAKVTPKQILLD